MGPRAMTPPSDEELDALFLLVRRETARETPHALPALIRGTAREPHVGVVVRSLPPLALGALALALAAIIPPALTALLATFWWALPIAGAVWLVSRVTYA